jgi:hypothetical protein
MRPNGALGSPAVTRGGQAHHQLPNISPRYRPLRSSFGRTTGWSPVRPPLRVGSARGPVGGCQHAGPTAGADGTHSSRRRSRRPHVPASPRGATVGALGQRSHTQDPAVRTVRHKGLRVSKSLRGLQVHRRPGGAARPHLEEGSESMARIRRQETQKKAAARERLRQEKVLRERELVEVQHKMDSEAFEEAFYMLDCDRSGQV